MLVIVEAGSVVVTVVPSRVKVVVVGGTTDVNVVTTVVPGSVRVEILCSV